MCTSMCVCVCLCVSRVHVIDTQQLYFVVWDKFEDGAGHGGGERTRRELELLLTFELVLGAKLRLDLTRRADLRVLRLRPVAVHAEVFGFT